MKKIWILVETDDTHNQWLTIFDSADAAFDQMQTRFRAWLCGEFSMDRNDEDYALHDFNAWIGHDMSVDDVEHDWQIWEKEVEV